MKRSTSCVFQWHHENLVRVVDTTDTRLSTIPTPSFPKWIVNNNQRGFPSACAKFSSTPCSSGMVSGMLSLRLDSSLHSSLANLSPLSSPLRPALCSLLFYRFIPVWLPSRGDVPIDRFEESHGGLGRGAACILKGEIDISYIWCQSDAKLNQRIFKVLFSRSSDPPPLDRSVIDRLYERSLARDIRYSVFATLRSVSFEKA